MLRIATLALLISMTPFTGCSCGREIPTSGCETDADCGDDGLFCTGASRCDRERRVCTIAASPCGTAEVCDEAARRCVPCTDPSTPECTPMDGGTRDAGTRDAGPICAELVPGTACSRAGTCGSMAECHEEWFYYWSTPGRSLPIRAFPGGYCATGCDARRVNDTCEPCASCSGSMVAGHFRLPLYYALGELEPSYGVCREHCTPSRTSSGCRRSGYTCDLETSTCMEACIDDQQCQITWQDIDGDGVSELVDRGADYPAFCDRTTGRCRTRGTPGAQIGDGCTDDAQCEDDGVCVLGADGTSGVCSRAGCRAPGFECPPGTACDVRNAGWQTSGCFVPCAVGAEDGTPAVRGTRTGGHPDCGLGRACVWNGISERGDARGGSCVPGAYSDRTTPNIGAPCRSIADCDSPFGYGTCLFAGAGHTDGICSMTSCATFIDAEGARVEGLLPGVSITTPICDPARGELCVALGSAREAPETYCLRRCDDASACAPGYACAEILTAVRLCWPTCYESSECRAGARCVSFDGGDCTASGSCYCSDRAP